jgi:REase_AHJR-like
MSNPLRNTVSATLESDALQSVAEQYRARGYHVIVEPTGPDVPSFLEGFQPDLIARKPGESVVVEVQTGTQRSVAGRYQHLAEVIRAQPGWRFDLVVMRPGEGEVPPVDATLPTEGELATRLKEADELQAAGSLSAAFIVLWAVVEGLMRLEAQRVGLPLERVMPTSALVRELYSAGEIAAEDYEMLLRLMETRNGLVHGFSTPVSAQDLSELKLIVEHLFAEVRGLPGKVL